MSEPINTGYELDQSERIGISALCRELAAQGVTVSTVEHVREVLTARCCAVNSLAHQMRAAEKTGAILFVAGAPVLSFASYGDWFANAQERYARHSLSSNNSVAVDAQGRPCFVGAHFRDDGSTYPIHVYTRPFTEGGPRG